MNTVQKRGILATTGAHQAAVRVFGGEPSAVRTPGGLSSKEFKLSKISLISIIVLVILVSLQLTTMLHLWNYCRAQSGTYYTDVAHLDTIIFIPFSYLFVPRLILR